MKLLKRNPLEGAGARGSGVDRKSAGNWPFFPNMTQSMQPNFRNNGTNIQRDNMPWNASPVNDKRTRKLQMGVGSDSRLPRCFLYRWWRRGSNRVNPTERERKSEDYLRVGHHGGKMWEEKSSLWHTRMRERKIMENPSAYLPFRHITFHG